MKRLLPILLLCSLGLTAAHAQSGIDQYLLCGAHVTAVATPDEGYRFVSWSDGNTDNPRQFYLLGDMDIVALFERDCHELAFPVRIINHWTLSADLTALRTQTGLQLREEDLQWYQAVGEPDIRPGDGDDLHMGSGAIFNIPQWPDGVRDYYAVIDPATPDPDYCSPLARTRLVRCNISDHTTRNVYLRPNFVHAGETMQLIGLQPTLTSRVVVTDITGKFAAEVTSLDTDELTLTAPTAPGWYIVWLENSDQHELLYFIVLDK